MFTTLSAQIGAALMAAVCLYAAASRGRPQVLAAVGVAVAWVGSAALQNRTNLVDPQYAIFVLDLGAALFFTTLALVYRRLWLMWVAAFQLLTTTTHIAVMIDLRILVWAYLTAYLVWSYLLLVALAFGGAQGFRERRAAAGRPPRA